MNTTNVISCSCLRAGCYCLAAQEHPEHLPAYATGGVATTGTLKLLHNLSIRQDGYLLGPFPIASITTIIKMMEKKKIENKKINSKAKMTTW